MNTLYMLLTLLFAALSAMGTVAAGVGATVAAIQIRRHWRDDDPKLSCTYLSEARSFGEEYREIWTATVRVVNTGKVPVSICAFAYFGARLEKRRVEVALDESFRPILVSPGEAVDVNARAENLRADKPPVFIDDLDVVSVDGTHYRAVRLPGFTPKGLTD